MFKFKIAQKCLNFTQRPELMAAFFFGIKTLKISNFECTYLNNQVFGNKSKINGFSAINFELFIIWFSFPADDLRKLSGNLNNLSFLMILHILQNRIPPHSALKLICNNLEITCLIAKKNAKIFKLVAALTC